MGQNQGPIKDPGQNSLRSMLLPIEFLYGHDLFIIINFLQLGLQP